MIYHFDKNVHFDPLSFDLLYCKHTIDATILQFTGVDITLIYILCKIMPRCVFAASNMYLEDKQITEFSAIWILCKEKYFFRLNDTYHNRKTIVKVNGKEFTLKELLLINIKFNGNKIKLFNPFFNGSNSGIEGFVYHNNEILKLYKSYDINTRKYKWNVVKNCSNDYKPYLRSEDILIEEIPSK